MPWFAATHRELDAGGSAIPLERLPLSRSSPFHPDLPEHWVWGWDLLGDAAVAVPEALVHYGPRGRPGPEQLRFQIGSNGLASGNTLLEAIVSALCEVIERDALARWIATGPAVSRRRVPDETLRAGRAGRLVDAIRAAGVSPHVFDLTVDTEVPTYCAFVFDEASGGARGARGYGAHLDPEVALERALTEACQSRLVWIAGSRDDMYRRQVRWSAAVGAEAAAALTVAEPCRELPERRDASTPTLQGDLRALLGRLERAGLEQAIVVDLSVPDEPVAVVKVIVPGLEGYRFSFYQPGLRAEAFKRGRI